MTQNTKNRTTLVYTIQLWSNIHNNRGEKLYDTVLSIYKWLMDGFKWFQKMYNYEEAPIPLKANYACKDIEEKSQERVIIEIGRPDDRLEQTFSHKKYDKTTHHRSFSLDNIGESHRITYFRSHDLDSQHGMNLLLFQPT